MKGGRLSKIMVLITTIKMVGETARGVSQQTGNEWRVQTVLLEFTDAEGVNRFWGTLFNERVDLFAESGLKVGDECMAEVTFSTRSFRNGFSKNEVNIIHIKKKG